MSKIHLITPAAVLETAQTVRLGTTGAKFAPEDAGKLVKLTAESRYDLCAAGDPIEGIVISVDKATAGGYSVGQIIKGSGGAIFAIADGLQATPGTGTIAVGDYVVCGTVTAKGTILPAAEGFPRVCKATNQPGAAVTTADNVVGNINAAIAKVVDAQKNLSFGWRVVSLGTVGTGAVATQIVIERVTATLPVA